MTLPPNYVNKAKDDALEARVGALEAGGGGGGGSVASTDITDSTTVGRALLTAADATAARTAAGAAASSHTHAATAISDSTSVGRSVLTAADAAAARSAIGAAASTPGGASPGDKVLYVYASGESGATGSYVCDGTADEVQINAALAAVGSETITHGTGTATPNTNGGKVVLIGRNFNIAGSILVPTQTRLTSQYGRFATRISRASGFTTGPMITNATANSQYLEIDGFTLDGNSVGEQGVYIGVGTGQEYDSFITVRNLFMWDIGTDGLHVENISGGRCRGNMFSDMRILNAGRYSVNIQGPDSFYSEIDSGSAGSDGFYIQHANNRIVNCKSWYSDGHGFHTTTASRDNQFSGCEAQDNLMHGYYIQGARNSFSSCCADSNSYDGSPSGSITGRTYNGFEVAGNYSNVHGTASDKNEGSRGARQVYGVHITSGVSCVVNVTTTGNYTGALSDGSSATRDVVVIGT